jgi:hypothetical protein
MAECRRSFFLRPSAFGRQLKGEEIRFYSDGEFLSDLFAAADGSH